MWYRLHVRCDVRDRGGVSLPRYWTKTKIFFPFFTSHSQSPSVVWTLKYLDKHLIDERQREL